MKQTEIWDFAGLNGQHAISSLLFFILPASSLRRTQTHTNKSRLDHNENQPYRATKYNEKSTKAYCYKNPFLLIIQLSRHLVRIWFFTLE